MSADVVLRTVVHPKSVTCNVHQLPEKIVTKKIQTKYIKFFQVITDEFFIKQSIVKADNKKYNNKLIKVL